MRNWFESGVMFAMILLALVVGTLKAGYMIAEDHFEQRMGSTPECHWED